MCVNSMFVLSCVGSGLATGWSPFKGDLPTLYEFIISELIRSGKRSRILIRQDRRRRRRRIRIVYSNIKRTCVYGDYSGHAVWSTKVSEILEFWNYGFKSQTGLHTYLYTSREYYPVNLQGLRWTDHASMWSSKYPNDSLFPKYNSELNKYPLSVTGK
jgi:hypothetical protein